MHFIILLLLMFVSFGCSQPKKIENIHFGPGPQDGEIEKEIIEECDKLKG